MIIPIHTLTITYMCYICTICLITIFTYYFIIVYRIFIYLHSINLIAFYLFTIPTYLLFILSNTVVVVKLTHTYIRIYLVHSHEYVSNTSIYTSDYHTVVYTYIYILPPLLFSIPFPRRPTTSASCSGESATHCTSQSLCCNLLYMHLLLCMR